VGWVDSLRGQIVGLDTTPLIYFTEENGDYLGLVDPFFESLGRGEFSVVTSIMTLLEALVRPIREGNIALAQRYKTFLLDSINVEMHDVTQDIAEEASRLRALYKIRTPDAIHLATALNANATYFLTNDIALSSLPGIKILVVDDLKQES
jgi:predicted nucleic acid-binding protein